MKNKNVVLRLKEIQESVEVELNNLVAEMLDDGFEEYDVQVIEEAKRSVENALLGYG
jgi:hypothetical protein